MARKQRHATRRWDRNRKRLVALWGGRLDFQPVEALEQLQEMSEGCDWLADRWQRFPFIPYVQAGLQRALWASFSGTGDVSKDALQGGRGSGWTWGYTTAVGFALNLDAIEVKANWMLVTDIPAFSLGRVTLADVPKLYHVNTGSDGQQYAFVSMHIISKAVPNWTWATFEHQFNPARCDIIGCRDLRSHSATIRTRRGHGVVIDQGRRHQSAIIGRRGRA